MANKATSTRKNRKKAHAAAFNELAIVATPTSDRAVTLGLVLVLGVGVILRVVYAINAAGSFFPDDIFQSLEPAHGLVYGYGMRVWEFENGARPWTVPGAYVAVLGLLRLLGVTSPEAYTLVMRLFTVLICSVWPWFAYRIARAFHSRAAGLAAAWLCATWYVFVLLAPRAFGHVFSVTFALWAVARIVEQGCEQEPHSRYTFVTGLLLGAAFAFRYQEGLVAAGLALWLLRQRRGRELPLLVLGAAIPALAVGMLDWLTWGAPFKSLVEYFHANLVLGVADRQGVEPSNFYLVRFFALVGFGGIALLPLLAAPRRALEFLLATAGGVLLVHSMIGHKEVRFVLSAYILLLIGGACGLAVLGERLRRGTSYWRSVIVVGMLLLLWTAGSGVRAARATFADFGLYAGLSENTASPWKNRRDLNRALAWTGKQPDVCGVSVFTYGKDIGGGRLQSTGGYTWLHRPIPFIEGARPEELNTLVNYVIACEGGNERAFAFHNLIPVTTIGTCHVQRDPAIRQCDPAALARQAHRWRW